MQAAFFYSPRVLHLRYGPAHPFQVERLGDVVRLLSALDLLPLDGSPVEPSPCTRAEIERFHDPAYVDALGNPALTDPRVLLELGLGTGDNPVFPGLWLYCQLIGGGSLAAARWLLEGIARGESRGAFHPAGGLHHAHADRASGFCYVNDGVLAIRELVEAGQRVLYVDVDAHHGDGVQEAFYDSPDVLTVSIHQDGRTLFPGTGFPNEIGLGAGVGYSANVPVLPGATDEDYDVFRDEILEPLRQAFRPTALVTEIGVDSLRDDPLTLLDWTLAGLDRFLLWAQGCGLPWLALGGGGYRRWNVIRGWSLVWARMLGRELPERRPLRDRAGSLPESWPLALWDEPPPRAICDAAMRRAQMEEVHSILQKLVLPRIRG